MTYSQIDITFTSMPAVGDYLEFSISGLGTASNLKETFKNNRSTSKEVKIPNMFDIGTEGDPIYIYSGNIADNYTTAFNLDYNSELDYAVYSYPADTGTGLGSVTIISNFPATFLEYHIPSCVEVAIYNIDDIDPEPELGEILINDITFSPAENICSNVVVNVTTNPTASYYSVTGSIPVTTNPISIEVDRGSSFLFTVYESIGNTASTIINTPPYLDYNDFTFNLSGTNLTISHTGATGLSLQYSLNGDSFSSSATFSSVNVPYSVIVKDQFGCSFSYLEELNITETDYILARSPYYVVYSATASSYDYCVIDLSIWTGSIYDVPADPTYNLTVYKSKASNEDVYADISDYIKGYLDPIINTDWLSGTVSVVETCWVKYKVTSYKISAGVGLQYEEVFSPIKVATLGYGYHEQGANPSLDSMILVDPTEHYSANNFNYTVSINSSSYDTSTNIIRDPYLSVISASKTLCSGEHNLYEIAFLNKCGVFDTFLFTRASKRILNITSNDYQFFQESPYNFSTNISTSKILDSNGVEEWTLNTDLLDESQNEYLQQLFQSDRWFLLDYSRGLVIPVLLSDKKFEPKYSLYEMAKIQWTLKFKSANSKINDIR